MEVDDKSGIPEGWSVVDGKGAPQATEKSAGYWEKRGIAGDVWHPADGASERHRADNEVLGMPPETAALGVGAIGRAVAAPAVNAGARIAAGLKAAGSQAAPNIKYELVKTVLQKAGLPAPIAVPAAMIISGIRRGGAEVPPSEPALAAQKGSNLPAVATGTSMQPAPFQPPQARAPVAEPPVRSGPVAVPSPAGKVTNPVSQVMQAAGAANVKLNGREIAQAIEAVRDQGVKAPDVIKAILDARVRPAGSVFSQLPSDADVAQAVAARNSKGRW